MEYYFSEGNYNLNMYSDSTKRKHLKELSEKQLNTVRKKIESEFNLDLNCVWVCKSTFGNVFADFVPEKTGPALLGAHKKLFELIHNEVKYLIVSRGISRNFLKKKIDKFEVLAINIDSYKTFIKSFKDQEKRIRLYLYKLSKAEEEIINNWINTNPKKEQELKKLSEEDLLDYLSSMNIDSIEKFNSFLQRINHSIENNISTNLKLYQSKLDEFKSMIKDDSKYETELSKFLHENIWILDFRYLKLDKCEREFQTSVGNVDIYTSREQFNVKKDVVIELKIPKDKIIKTYRNKPAFTAEVGNAISQVINYMETQKESYKLLNGLLILGRKKEPFIQILNDHLTKIKVITYEEMAENCQIVLDAFKLKEK